MNQKTILLLLGGVGAYFYLTSRVPAYTVAANGTQVPATFIDSLTVMLTGATPPAAVPTQTVSLTATPGGATMSYTN
jgi:hypothetical protein